MVWERRTCVLLVALAALPGCQSFVGDYDTDLEPTASSVEPVDSSHLCDIERSNFVFDLDLASSDAQPDLESYYALANPELAAHFDALAQSFSDGEASLGVTYLTGAAGVGKSFAIGNVLDGFAETDMCTASLGDLFGEDVGLLDFSVTAAPDLATLDEGIVFNELPTIAEPETFEIESLLSAAGCIVDSSVVPLVVIDDLDELQNESSTAILEAIDNYVLDGAPGAGSFLHFIVAGRSSAFGTWLTAPERTRANSENLERFDLAAPTYRTAGDLEFRLRGYLDFIGELETTESNGELDAYIASFTEAVAAHPFLTYSTGNLAVGNVVIEHTAPGRAESEAELKAGLFDDILLRNSQSHGRPGDGGEYDAAYVRVLEDIAVRYVEVDDAGDFAVRSGDTVEVTDGEGSSLGEVRVRDVLDRGGVAFLTSAVASTTRYRFEPFWLHAHLIERHNQRLDPDYSYHPCE
jgi:hypothetical protein